MARRIKFQILVLHHLQNLTFLWTPNTASPSYISYDSALAVVRVESQYNSLEVFFATPIKEFMCLMLTDIPIYMSLPDRHTVDTGGES